MTNGLTSRSRSLTNRLFKELRTISARILALSILPPFFNHDKLEYQVHTPDGTHKYKYKTNWWTGRTTFDYDFDD